MQPVGKGCIDVVTEENGDVTIPAREDTTQIFAQTPNIESEKYGGYHTFVLRETESGRKIARHVMLIVKEVDRQGKKENYGQNRAM